MENQLRKKEQEYNKYNISLSSFSKEEKEGKEGKEERKHKKHFIVKKEIENLKKKSLKRWCYFYYLERGYLPNPLKIAGLGDTWLKEYRKIINKLLKRS